MSNIAAAKVMKPIRRLLGEPRKTGDTITEDELASMPKYSVKALVTGGKLELFTKSLSKADEGFEMRLSIVEAKLEDVLNGNAGVVDKPATPAKKRGRPRGSQNKPKE